MEIKNVALSTTPSVNLDLLALIYVEDDPKMGKLISLRATLNSDACDPVQIEEYPSEWTATWFEIAQKGFWECWDEINSKTPGKISLIDGYSVIQAECYMGLDKLPVISGNKHELANLFLALSPGWYLVECLR